MVQNGRSYHHPASFDDRSYLMAPATRDAVVNSMNDGMIVLDRPKSYHRHEPIGTPHYA